MAEDPVSKEQHRADMAELKSELKEELAGVRQEIAVLAKTIEANQQAMLLRFEQADQRHNDLVTKMDQRHTDLLAAMTQRFDQIDQQRAEDRQLMLERFQQVDKRFELVEQQFSRHETRLVSLENGMRTTFVTVSIVGVGVAAQLFYTLMRSGAKPTP